MKKNDKYPIKGTLIIPNQIEAQGTYWKMGINNQTIVIKNSRIEDLILSIVIFFNLKVF
jgi:hypothetical protein